MDTKTQIATLREGRADEDFYTGLLVDLEDQIGKVDKQIGMIEDAVLVYHMQRAPTRRTWYINVGQCRVDRAKWIVNDFRDNIRSAEAVTPAQSYGESSVPVQEDEFLAMYQDDTYQTQVEHNDIQTTWDGSELLETFYSKRARLLALYGRLYQAVRNRNDDQIIGIICDVQIDASSKSREPYGRWTNIRLTGLASPDKAD